MQDEEEDMDCQHEHSDEGESNWIDLLFTPMESPIYGGQSIFISYGGHLSPLQKDIDYYLLFEGTNLRHLTSTKFVNPFTLQAVVPDHDVAEAVDLSVTCKMKESYMVRAKTKFTFTLDMTMLLAQSLAMNALNSSALKQLEVMYNSLLMMTADERKGLDQRLATAFIQLHLPVSWSLVNNQATWTLLHLCAKYDLLMLAEFVGSRQGSMDALLVKDENGQTPMDIAAANQNIELMELFSRSLLQNVSIKLLRPLKPIQNHELSLDVDSCMLLTLSTVEKSQPKEPQRMKRKRGDRVRIPLEEAPVDCEAGGTQKPVIKRHKLGTTTITNVISNGQRTIEQDAKLLEDLHNLALESKRSTSLKQSNKQEGPFSHPLANSLQKLREINLEIQRLRYLTQENDLQVDEEVDDRRTRSYSCPDSFDASRSDRMIHGMRRHSASLSSCDEESGGSRRPFDKHAYAEDDTEDKIAERTYEQEKTDENVPEESKAQECDDKNEDHGECTLKEPGITISLVDAEEEGEIKGDDQLVMDLSIVLDNAVATEDDSKESSIMENEVTEHLKGASLRPADEDDSGLNEILDESTVEEDESMAGKAQNLEEKKIAKSSPVSSKSHDGTEAAMEGAEKEGDKASVVADQSEVFAEGNKEVGDLDVQENVVVIAQGSQEESNQSYDQQEFLSRSGNNMVSEMRTLTAVTEETEEELLELDVKEDADPFAHKSHSLEEIKALRWSEERLHRSAEQVYLPKVVLRKGILKKDRPLSDNYDNIKMIARESQLNRLGKQSDSEDSLSGLDKRKSKSLDMLLVDDENGKSPSLASSQLSLSDIHGSVESLQSVDRLEASSIPLYRTKSGGSASLGHRASLNDINFSMRDDMDEHVPTIKKKRSRFSFKRKSKSTTALDKKGVASNEDDRRKTIMGGISTEKLFAQRRGEDFGKNKRQNVTDHSRISNRDSGIDSTCELRLDDIMLASVSVKDGSYAQSISETGGNYLQPSRERLRSSSEVSGDRDTEDDELDVDTDEGTSSEIAERVRKSSICTEEKKKKFGILRKGKKEKKSGKEKDASDKALKKAHKDTKTSFLGKKHSFRQGPRSSSTSTSDSKMFARGSSTGKPGETSMHSSSMGNLRGSGRGRPSPTGSRRNLEIVDGGIPDSDHSSTNLNSALSSSLSSLNIEDLADAPFEVDDLSQYDSDLALNNEPETWSDLVEKKVQRKLHAKDIKRQDVIYELIFTERNYVRTLKIVSRIYCVGFRRELGMDEHTIEALFPRLDDLLEINGKFCERLKKRQVESNNNVIEEVGDILVDQFAGPKGEFMKEVYGYFCSRHLQAVALYKDLMKTDKKFALFVRKCMLNERVRRLSIPECITLATQRLTKYPLLFEAILKATKDFRRSYACLFCWFQQASDESKSDYENLKQSIKKVKEVLMAVDDYVRDYEKEQQLFEIKRRIDPRGEAQFKNGQTFKNSKLFNKRSVLLNDGTLTWKGKTKSVDVRAILLSDKIFFVHEKDQRYNLANLDNKPPVIYLRCLLARQVATDMRALFLVNNEGPEMYEMVCPSVKIKNQWMKMISEAIENKPDEEEENLSDLEEEQRKEEESRVVRLKEIMESLQITDYQFVNLIADKNKLVVEMRELIEKMGSSTKTSTSNLELTATDVLEGRETLEKAISETSSLTTLLYDSDMQAMNSQLQALTTTTAPKRSETFGGFDRNTKSLIPPIQVSRASSLKQENRLSLGGKTLAMLENNHGIPDPKERIRKTSQGIMSVIGRSKPNESAEDISSASSSNSNIGPVSNATAQKILAVTQLKDYLTSLMDITNKQDIELASIRVELHESRAEVNKLRSERQSVEEKLIQQQKEHDRQISRQKETSSKLERTVDRLNKQINEYKYQLEKMESKYLELQKRLSLTSNSKSSKSNSLSSLHNRHREHVPPNSHNAGRSAHSRDSSDDQDVIFF